MESRLVCCIAVLMMTSVSCFGVDVDLESQITVDIDSMNRTLSLNESDGISWVEFAYAEDKRNATLYYSVLQKGIYEASDTNLEKNSIFEWETVTVNFFHALGNARFLIGTEASLAVYILPQGSQPSEILLCEGKGCCQQKRECKEIEGEIGPALVHPDDSNIIYFTAASTIYTVTIGAKNPIIMSVLDHTRDEVTALAINLDHSKIFAFQKTSAYIPLPINQIEISNFSEYVLFSLSLKIAQAFFIEENTAICLSTTQEVFLLNVRNGAISKLCQEDTTYLPCYDIECNCEQMFAALLIDYQPQDRILRVLDGGRNIRAISLNIDESLVNYSMTTSSAVYKNQPIETGSDKKSEKKEPTKPLTWGLSSAVILSIGVSSVFIGLYIRKRRDYRNMSRHRKPQERSADIELAASEVTEPGREYQQSQNELVHPVGPAMSEQSDTHCEGFYVDDPYYLEIEDSDSDQMTTQVVAQNRQNRPRLPSPTETAGTDDTDLDSSVYEVMDNGQVSSLERSVRDQQQDNIEDTEYFVTPPGSVCESNTESTESPQQHPSTADHNADQAADNNSNMFMTLMSNTMPVTLRTTLSSLFSAPYIETDSSLHF